jgi:hypothetical protein
VIFGRFWAILDTNFGGNSDGIWHEEKDKEETLDLPYDI